MTEGWNTAWEGISAEEGREEVGGAGYAGGGRLSDLVSSLIGREVNVAWSPMNLDLCFRRLEDGDRLDGMVLGFDCESWCELHCGGGYESSRSLGHQFYIHPADPL